MVVYDLICGYSQLQKGNALHFASVLNCWHAPGGTTLIKLFLILHYRAGTFGAGGGVVPSFQRHAGKLLHAASDAFIAAFVVQLVVQSGIKLLFTGLATQLGLRPQLPFGFGAGGAAGFGGGAAGFGGGTTPPPAPKVPAL